jgi:tetratricopeptide (TPR) repeat protein
LWALPTPLPTPHSPLPTFLLATLLTTLATIAPIHAQEKLEDFDYWASLCNTMLNAQLYEEALTACDQAVGLFPGDPEAWNDRGDVLFALERYAEALVSYEQTLRQSPTDSLVQAKRCATLVALGQNEAAVDSCEDGIEIDGEWRDGTPAIAWYHRGAALTQEDKLPEALESYDWALRIDPTYSPAWAGRCLSLAQLSRFESALEACDRAIQNDNWDFTSPAIAWLNRGRALVELARNPDASQSYLKYANPSDLTDPSFSSNLTYQIYGEALESYNRALAIDPDNEIAWTEQGLVLGRLGRNTESLSSHEWALGLDENYALALANKCNTLNRLGEYEDALASCDLAIQEGDNRWGDDGAAFAWNQRGNAFAGLARYGEGLASVNRAIALRPDYAEAWLNRSVLLWLMQRYTDALLATQRAIELRPDSSRAWFNQGRIQVSIGALDSAVASYRRALEGDVFLGGQPKEEDIWVNLSAVLWRLGRFSEALNAADAAIALDPNLPLAWYNRALSQMSLRNYSAAVVSYESAIALDPNNADLWAGLGISYRALRDFPNALAALQTALELNPDHEQAQTNLEAVMDAIAMPGS